METKYRNHVHEVSHGILAILRNCKVQKICMLDSEDNPGKAFIDHPGDGQDPESALTRLAVSCAGYMGENVVFGDYTPTWRYDEHPDADWHVCYQCAIYAKGIKEDIDLINLQASADRRHKWCLDFPQLQRDCYESLIHDVKADVVAELTAIKDVIEPLALLLFERKELDGDCFTEEFNVQRSRIKPGTPSVPPKKKRDRGWRRI